MRVEPGAQPQPSLARHALVPVTLLAAAFAYYAAGWSLAATIALAAGLLLVQVWSGVWAAASRDRLDRELLVLVAKKDTGALVPRVRAAWGLRAFGRPAELAERLGRAHREAGEAAAAQRAYGAALAGYGGSAPLTVVSGLGLSAYEAGDDGVAIEALRASLDAMPELAEARARLAHALVRSGGSLAEAEALFAEGASERALVRALAAARAGRRSEAEKLARDLPRAGVLGAALEGALAGEASEPAKKPAQKSAKKPAQKPARKRS